MRESDLRPYEQAYWRLWELAYMRGGSKNAHGFDPMGVMGEASRLLILPEQPTHAGVLQFRLYQGTGVWPEEPLDTFYILLAGKGHLDMLSKQYKDMYGTSEWWGWAQLWQDWKGSEWLLPLICHWKKSIPRGEEDGRKR